MCRVALHRSGARSVSVAPTAGYEAHVGNRTHLRIFPQSFLDARRHRSFAAGLRHGHELLDADAAKADVTGYYEDKLAVIFSRSDLKRGVEESGLREVRRIARRI